MASLWKKTSLWFNKATQSDKQRMSFCLPPFWSKYVIRIRDCLQYSECCNSSPVYWINETDVGSEKDCCFLVCLLLPQRSSERKTSLPELISGQQADPSPASPWTLRPHLYVLPGQSPPASLFQGPPELSTSNKSSGIKGHSVYYQYIQDSSSSSCMSVSIFVQMVYIIRHGGQVLGCGGDDDNRCIYSHLPQKGMFCLATCQPSKVHIQLIL